MAFPEDVLTADEQVVLHLHPHWKALVRPVVVVLLAVGALVAALWFGVGAIGAYVVAGAGLLLVLRFALWPYLVWQGTNYVFTDERVLLQYGVFTRDRRDIPLGRVNDHAMRQSVVGRVLGYGTLTIESAGERGQSVLTDVPAVERVQTTLYELVDAHHDKHSLGDDELREILGENRRDTTGPADDQGVETAR